MTFDMIQITMMMMLSTPHRTLQVTLISIRWLMIISTVIPSSALTPSSVHYHDFLDSYKLVSSSEDEKFDDMKIIDDLYGQVMKCLKPSHLYC
jgi:hypothetical protein